MYIHSNQSVIVATFGYGDQPAMVLKAYPDGNVLVRFDADCPYPLAGSQLIYERADLRPKEKQ